MKEENKSFYKEQAASTREEMKSIRKLKNQFIRRRRMLCAKDADFEKLSAETDNNGEVQSLVYDQTTVDSMVTAYVNILSRKVDFMTKAKQMRAKAEEYVEKIEYCKNESALRLLQQQEQGTDKKDKKDMTPEEKQAAKEKKQAAKKEKMNKMCEKMKEKCSKENNQDDKDPKTLIPADCDYNKKGGVDKALADADFKNACAKFMVNRFVKKSMEIDTGAITKDLAEDTASGLRYLDSTFKVIADKDDPTQSDTTFNDATITEEETKVDIGTEDQDGSETDGGNNDKSDDNVSAGFLKVTSAVMFFFAIFF